MKPSMIKFVTYANAYPEFHDLKKKISGSPGQAIQRIKKIIFPLLALLLAFPALAQEPAADQNPRHASSRDKYLKLADSINQGQSTTLQDTYKAIDYLADRQEARDARKQYRRDLRMERAKRGYYDDYYYYSPYSQHYGAQFYHPYFYRWNGTRGWRAIGYPLY